MIKRQVEYILNKYQKARNSDKSLTLNLWYQYYSHYFKYVDGKWYIEVDKIYDLPSPWSIRRARQKIQEEGKFLADQQVQNYRKDSQDIISKTINNEKAGWFVQ